MKLPVVIAGSPNDTALCDSICKPFPGGVLSMAGKTNLMELSWLISQSKAVITNDSSPIHFASAHNIPTVAVFGATVKDFGYTSLSDKNRIAEVEGLKCRPCGIHCGNNCPEKHFKCMKDQNAEVIFSMLQEILKEKK